MLLFKNFFLNYSKVIIPGFWVGYLLGFLMLSIGVNILPLYKDTKHPFVRFHAVSSGSNQMFLTARMIKELADEKMVGKKRLVLIVGDSVLRGHGNTQESSFGPQLASLLSNADTGVLNLSRDGMFGPTIYSIHKYLLEFYPDTFLVTVMPGHIVASISSNMEYGYTAFDLFYKKQDLLSKKFTEKYAESRFNEIRYIAKANHYFGFLDFGQAFRYQIAQLLYTEHVRYGKVKVIQPIKTAVDGEIDYHWHRDNLNYTDSHIEGEMNYWRKFSREPFQPLAWDQYYDLVSSSQWKKVVLIKQFPVPFLRQQMGRDYSQLENASAKFENHFKSKGAHVVSSVVLQYNNEYADMLHWSKEGASRMAAQVAVELCNMYSCDKPPR